MRSRTPSSAVVVLLALSLAVGLVPVPAQAQGTDSAPECSFPVSEPDATGEMVTVAERPERIVVLQASAAQTVWELGASGRVVGAPVGSYTDYLEGIEDTENVLNADEFVVNQEAVVQLDADIVLAPNVVPDGTVERLRDADQTVFKFGFARSFDSIAEKTELTGRLIGSCAEAEGTNAAYRDRIESVEADTDPDRTPRVLYYTDGFVAGSGTFIDEIVTTAGGANVAADNGVEGYAELNEEALVEWNPEVVVVSNQQDGLPGTPAFESTFAVRNDQIAVVDGNYISQPAPRITVALEAVAEAVSEADLEAGPTTTAADPDEPDDAERSTATAEPTDTGGPTDDAVAGQPGFGALAGAVALLAFAFLARRA